jgi:DNA-binding protein H-NS
MAALHELLAQQRELERQIEQLRSSERAAAMLKIRELMQAYGLTASDLAGPDRTKGTATPGSRKGVAAPVKFRDAQGNTWSGRGLKPKWLQAALEQGNSLEEFAV